MLWDRRGGFLETDLDTVNLQRSGVPQRTGVIAGFLEGLARTPLAVLRCGQDG